jgi:hypothetical protein
VAELVARGEYVELEGDVPVLVVRNLDPAGEREPGRRYGVEIRLLAGAREGETWFVDEAAVSRLVPKVAHPPLEPGSYAAVTGSGAIAYANWEALDPASLPADDAEDGAFRIDEGVRVVVLEAREEAVRVRVDDGSGLAGRVGVVARSALRPIVPPTRPPAPEPGAGR